MGFFSWKCAKSERPVMAECAVRRSPFEFASQVVLLFKNGDRISGTYDGYGRVGEHEFFEEPEDTWRMVIKRYYNGESFFDLPENKYDPGQGFFWGDADLEEFFPDAQELRA